MPALSTRSALFGGILVVVLAVGGSGLVSWGVASNTALPSAGQGGSAGADGSDGTDGTDGADGTDGVDGRDGAPGAAGPAGPRGPAGPTGPAGAEGATGSPGPVGPMGPQGPAGPEGPAGASGAAGPAGADGLGIALSRYEATGPFTVGVLPPNAPLPIPTVTSTSPDVTSTPGATASVSIQTPGFYRIAYGVTAENPIGSLSTALVVAGATTLLLPQTAPFGSYRQTVADETTLYLQPGDTVRVQFATPNGLFAVTVDAAFFRVDRIA